MTKKHPSLIHLGFTVTCVLIMGWLDYLTGPEVIITLFYLIPLIYSAWFLGMGAGLVFALIAAFFSVFTDILFVGQHYSHWAILWYNVFARLGVFAVVAFVLARLKQMFDKQTEHIRQIQKLSDAKSEFVSSVSHELRTPLTAIKENLLIVYDGSAGALTFEQKDFLRAATRNVDRLERLVGDILDFQLLDYGRMSFHFQPGDLNDLVREIESAFKHLASAKALEIKTDLDQQLPLVDMDRGRLHQVLSNLVQNSIRYSDRGTITLRTLSGDTNVIVSVIDEGRGISEEDMTKLFQSFQRLSSSATPYIEGTGLGLAISKKIIDAHRGRIEAFSHEGRGTIFRITLKRHLKKEAH